MSKRKAAAVRHMGGKIRYIVGLLLASSSTVALADEVGPAIITVTAPESEGRVSPPHMALDGDALLDRQPSSIGDALRRLPGVSVRPNSRGETIARVRGAEERQTQVFLDGAPLSVPWDGRIDLGVLPAGLVGRIDVVKGAVPIEYGTNAVAGVIDLQSRRGGDDGGSVTAVAQAGTLGALNASGVFTQSDGTTSVTVAAGHLARNAERVADLGILPFSQAKSSERTNTDLNSTSFFAAISTETGPAKLRASVLTFDAERGIAPESDRNPALFAPRYWRYPAIKFTQATVSAETEVSQKTTLRAVVWRQWFSQEIDAYRTADYAALRSRQEDEDNSQGGRLTLAQTLGDVTFRWSASAQTTHHAQIDTAFPSGSAGPRLTFRQNFLSAGSEADVPIGAATRLTAGLAYDRASTPLTGDKPAQAPNDAIAFSLALRQKLSDDVSLTLSGGRRTRFPSARELFGEALGRFLINPDLAPETAWLADAELTWRGKMITATVNPFFIRGEGTISQRVVRVGTQSLRQRFNLSGSTAYGVDFGLVATLSPSFALEATGTALSAHSDVGDAAFRRLVQRPAYEATLALDYRPLDKFDIRAEVHRTGNAVDLGPDGMKGRLAPSTEFNVRGSVPVLDLGHRVRLSLTGSVDNVTDAVVTPQLGLPLPGRTMRVGIRVE